MNTTETIKLMLKSLELVDEAMPFPVAKAGIQAGKDWLERGREPVAYLKTWHKNDNQYADIWQWESGIEALEDGNHYLYKD